MNSKYFKIFAVSFLSLGHIWMAKASADELTYQESQTIDIKLLPGEYWWGGLSVDGDRMPHGGTTVTQA